MTQTDSTQRVHHLRTKNRKRNEIKENQRGNSATRMWMHRLLARPGQTRMAIRHPMYISMRMNNDVAPCTPADRGKRNKNNYKEKATWKVRRRNQTCLEIEIGSYEPRKMFLITVKIRRSCYSRTGANDQEYKKNTRDKRKQNLNTTFGTDRFCGLWLWVYCVGLMRKIRLHPKHSDVLKRYR